MTVEAVQVAAVALSILEQRDVAQRITERWAAIRAAFEADKEIDHE